MFENTNLIWNCHNQIRNNTKPIGKIYNDLFLWTAFIKQKKDTKTVKIINFFHKFIIMSKCMQFLLNNFIGRFNEQLFFGLVFSRSAFRKYFQLLLLTLSLLDLNVFLRVFDYPHNGVLFSIWICSFDELQLIILKDVLNKIPHDLIIQRKTLLKLDSLSKFWIWSCAKRYIFNIWSRIQSICYLLQNMRLHHFAL